LIDEPVAGIDVDNRAKIIALVKDLKSEGKTILQIEHNASYIEATSDKTFYLENGVVAC
jgi:ABC-type Mn2+/Zn2+ transport system ATPase subunit